MRRLLVLAPLLLAGCSLLFPSTITSSTMHDGYELTCVNVSIQECTLMADDYLRSTGALEPRPIVSMEITDRGVRTVCRDKSTGKECLTYTP